ncbi:MAG: Hsp33 family molecular chaperone HslO [Alphaproteobacteria bacterium]|nr:Hsp33 family molecular chaperone HslO [Alphaproteobacteria bacterium]
MPLALDPATLPTDDIVLPFQVDTVRGRLVRLGPAVDRILKQHAYPAAVGQALAEMVALSAALALTLKYEGVFTMQVKGDGPVRLMVADVTTGGALRGYAQFDADRVAALGRDTPSVPRLFGAGYLAFTVDQGDATERYQGIVELTGATLAECAHHYFKQSEQFRAGLKVAAQLGADGRWRAGALMVQALPPEGAQGSAEGRDLARPLDAAVEDAEEIWRRALILMSSARSGELVDPDLPAWRLVDRLFLAEGVKIFRPHDLHHGCRCSRDRVTSVLQTLPIAELQDMKVDGTVRVTCEFCNTSYEYADADLAALHADTPSA